MGLAAGTAEFVLFVNPDARIESASLSTLVSVLRADPRLGSVGPLTVGEGGQLHRTQRRFPRLRSTYAQALGLHRVAPFASWTGEVIQERAAYTRPGMPDWLSGSCVLIRRVALDEVGGMDEGFFLYSEETDLFRRLRHRGWRARFEPRATAYHQGYGSAPWETVSPILAHSRVRYARKHHGTLVAFLEAIGVATDAVVRATARIGRPERRRGLSGGSTSGAQGSAPVEPHVSKFAVDAERLQLTERELELARASDALAELGRTLSPGRRRDVRASRRGAARLAHAPRLRRPGTGISGTPRVARMHVSTAKSSATRSTERSSLTLPPACASGSTSVRSRSRSSSGCRLHWIDCMDS